MSRLLELGLRAWALVLLIAAALWVLGPYGAGYLFYRDELMRWPLMSSRGGLLDGWATGPIFGAYLTEESARDTVSALNEQLTAYDGGPVAGSFGDINGGWSVQFSILTWWQNVAFTALKVVPLLVMAALWWSLASVVRQSRTESVFTQANARLLSLAGLVIAAGAPLLTLATWAFRRWVVASSQLAGRVEVPELGVESVPWTAVAAGVALLVLGSVWRRGVTLQRDVEGLV